MGNALKSGDFDPTFGQDGHLDLSLDAATLLLPDQKILAVGPLEAPVGFKVLRLLPNGGPDPTFGEEGVDVRLPHDFTGDLTGFACALQSDHKIVVAAALYAGEYDSRVLVARLHADGRLDDTFGNAGVTIVDAQPGPEDIVRRVMVLPDDRIVLIVRSIVPFVSSTDVFVRLFADGTFDYSFGEGGFTDLLADRKAEVSSGLQPDGKMVVAGSASHPDVNSQPLVVRYLGNGQRDPSFGEDGYVYLDYSDAYPNYTWWQAHGFALQTDGKIMLVGDCTDSSAGGGPSSLTWYARLLPDGAIDTSFNGGEVLFSHLDGVSWVGISVVVAADGKVVAAGSTLGDAKAVIERLMPDGVADPTFGDGGSVVADLPGNGLWLPIALTIQSDGNLLMRARTIVHSAPIRLSRVLY